MTQTGIAVATSIPPTLARKDAGRDADREYQRLCLSSWLECGFRVMSINAADEIAALAGRYPEITFIESMKAVHPGSGGKTPYIADLLDALIAAREPVLGIINSDIVFEPSSAWREQLPKLVNSAVVTGQRHDATSLAKGTFRKYYWGFDYFFFDRDAAQRLATSAADFAMGLAWWDYWLPASASMNGRDVVVLDRPTVAHLVHKEPYLDTGWRRMGFEFARFIEREARARSEAVPPSIGALLPSCRQLAGIPVDSPPSHEIDLKISQMALDYIPQLTRSALTFDRGQPTPQAEANKDQLTPTIVFQRFEERLWAGQTLEHAKRLEVEGRPHEAVSEFRAALEKTPEDFDVLAAFGEYLLRQRNFGAAIELFKKAAEQQPDSCRLLNVLAAALRASNRYDEAIDCLEHALHVEPDDEASVCNLALTLNEAGRRNEAIRRLEAALKKSPDFADASALLARLRGR